LQSYKTSEIGPHTVVIIRQESNVSTKSEQQQTYNSSKMDV